MGLLVFGVGTACKAASDSPKSANETLVQESLNLQRASVQEQIRAVSHQSGISRQQPLTPARDYITPLLPLLAPVPLRFSDCPRLHTLEINELVADAAKEQSLPPALIRAVMKQESGFKPCAISVKGAEGLMQLMPATALGFHVTDPFDPRQNVEAGAALLKQLFVKYGGDLKLVLGAYNAGQARVDTTNGVPDITETRNYVSSILRALGIEEQKPETEFSFPASVEPLNTIGLDGLNWMSPQSQSQPAPFPIFDH